MVLLHGSANSTYVHASKLTNLRIPLSKPLQPKASKFAVDFQVVNQPLKLEVIANLLS